VTRRSKHAQRDFAQMKADPNAGVYRQFMPPAGCEHSETLQHRVTGSKRLASTIVRGGVISAKAGHHAIARHMKDRAAVYCRDPRQQTEKLIQQWQDSRGGEAFSKPGVAAQIGEQHREAAGPTNRARASLDR
jgi:hypothetical protein